MAAQMPRKLEKAYRGYATKAWSEQMGGHRPAQRQEASPFVKRRNKKSPTPGQKDEPTSKGGCSQLASWLSHQRMRISIPPAILSSLMSKRRSIAKYDVEGGTYLEYRCCSADLKT